LKRGSAGLAAARTKNEGFEAGDFHHRFADLVFLLLPLAKETGEQQTTQPPTA
jgi:hypothetical protein